MEVITTCISHKLQNPSNLGYPQTRVRQHIPEACRMGRAAQMNLKLAVLPMVRVWDRHANNVDRFPPQCVMHHTMVVWLYAIGSYYAGRAVKTDASTEQLPPTLLLWTDSLH